MELSYWQSRWEKGNTGWHMQKVYPPLIRYRDTLAIYKGASVLVPLCGKSLDLQWFMEQECEVTGVDISEQAARSFFEKQGLEFTIGQKNDFTIYRSDRLQFWVGDFLKLKPSYIDTPDLIYDKAALIALPPDRRRTYASHLQDFTGEQTQIFLNAFEYDQTEMTGPPFAVHSREVESLFGDRFTIKLLEEHSLFDDLKKFRQRGLTSYLTEKVYLLSSR